MSNTPVKNLPGQIGRYKVDVINQLTRDVVAAYKSSFKDAVEIQTKSMRDNLRDAVQNVTMERPEKEGGIYAYKAKNPNRRYEHGGLADYRYYALNAEIKDGEAQIAFYQKRDIPHESFDDIWGHTDTRRIVETGSPDFFNQPYPRPYFDFIAEELAKTLPEDIDNRIASSMRQRGF